VLSRLEDEWLPAIDRVVHGRGAVEAERGVQGEPRRRQRLGTALEVEVVVAVAGVEAAPAGHHQSALAEQSEVVGHEALRLTGPLDQLTDPVVRPSELGEQSPPPAYSVPTSQGRGARDRIAPASSCRLRSQGGQQNVQPPWHPHRGFSAW